MNNEPNLEWEERKSDTPFYVHIVAGSLAGISEHIFTLPLDNLKTHIQSTSMSIKEAYVDIKSSGIANFFRGSWVLTLGSVPAHAFFFLNFEISKRYLANKPGIDVFGNMAVGGIAHVFHDLTMTPCEMVKQRAQLTNNPYPIKIIRSIIKDEGVFSLWRSLPVHLISNIPNAMIIVSANENLKILYKKFIGEHNLYSYFLCSGIAGVLAAIATTPLDNIITRLNVQNLYESKEKNHSKGLPKVGVKGNNTLVSADNKQNSKINYKSTGSVKNHIKPASHDFAVKYPNMLNTIKIISQEEGFKGFYKGLALRTCNYALSTAIAWTTYEHFKNIMIKNKH